MPINVSDNDDDDVTNWLQKKGQQQFTGQWGEEEVRVEAAEEVESSSNSSTSTSWNVESN